MRAGRCLGQMQLNSDLAHGGLVPLAAATGRYIPQPAELLEAHPTPNTCHQLSSPRATPRAEPKGSQPWEELSLQRQLLLPVTLLLSKTPTIRQQENCCLHLTLPFEKISSPGSWTQSSFPERLLRWSDTLRILAMTNSA